MPKTAVSAVVGRYPPHGALPAAPQHLLGSPVARKALLVAAELATRRAFIPPPPDTLETRILAQLSSCLSDQLLDLVTHPLNRENVLNRASIEGPLVFNRAKLHLQAPRT